MKCCLTGLLAIVILLYLWDQWRSQYEVVDEMLVLFVVALSIESLSPINKISVVDQSIVHNNHQVFASKINRKPRIHEASTHCIALLAAASGFSGTPPFTVFTTSSASCCTSPEAVPCFTCRCHKRILLTWITPTHPRKKLTAANLVEASVYYYDKVARSDTQNITRFDNEAPPGPDCTRCR